ncbi:hypothetical protein ACFSWE_04425 [Leucobacter albus]|uniref:Acyl-CoA carboxylase epsilon subunit-like protein n=1 Tax=Leucobacter albus TaxID=272210 RepID=A0ABW3TNM1_9MICO
MSETNARLAEDTVAEAAVAEAAVAEAALNSELDALDGDLPPDAAARDAAKREDAGEADEAINGDDITFVTRGVSDDERAAVIAVLTAARAEETRKVKRVARRDREPWARSQRVPDGFADLLIEG